MEMPSHRPHASLGERVHLKGHNTQHGRITGITQSDPVEVTWEDGTMEKIWLYNLTSIDSKERAAKRGAARWRHAMDGK